MSETPEKLINEDLRNIINIDKNSLSGQEKAYYVKIWLEDEHLNYDSI